MVKRAVITVVYRTYEEQLTGSIHFDDNDIRYVLMDETYRDDRSFFLFFATL